MNPPVPDSIVIRPDTGRSGSTVSIHRAGWIISTPWHIIENGHITVRNGRIFEVQKGYPKGAGPSEIVDHGPGVLLSGLVNAHVHLELTALKGKLDYARGFRSWVRDLMMMREAAGIELLKQEAQIGAGHFQASGTLCAGEISTLGITREILENAGLFGVWFRERVGTGDAAEDHPLCRRGSEGGLHQSVAGHAPHTTSPKLLKLLKQESASKDLPFSIHLAESADETRFITTGAGQWADFLRERDIDFSSWPVPCRSPVDYLKKLGLLDSKTIAVHLLGTDEADLESMVTSGTKIVLCPRSNNNLHGRLPDLTTMLAMGLKPALGTDSLASNDSLSMFDEMAFTMQHYPGIDPALILAMATLFGAMTLGMDRHLGTLEPGKLGDCLYLPLEAASSKTLMESIIHHDP